MSETETMSDVLSMDGGATVEEEILAKFGDRLLAFEVTLQHGGSNHEVKRRYEFHHAKGEA